MTEHKRHFFIVGAVLSVLVGLLNVSPYIIAFENVQSATLSGEKFHYFYQDSELRYISRIREVTEGSYSISSPVFYEYKSAENIQQPYGEWFYATLAFFDSSYVVPVVMFSKFALPAALFFLLYTVFFQLLHFLMPKVNNFIIPLSALVAILISHGLEFYRIENINQLLTGNYNSPFLSTWTRAVNPIFGGLLFFIASLFLLKLDVKKYRFIKVLTLGIAIGLSTAYFFSFVLIVLTATIYGLFSIIYREWRKLIDLSAVALISVVINLNYFFIIFGNDLESNGSLEKNGLFFTHEPMINKALLLASLIFILCIGVRIGREKSFGLFQNSSVRLSAAFLIAGHISYNFQIVTGFTIWPAHFNLYTDPIAIIVIIFSLVWIFLTVMPEKFLKASVSLASPLIWLGIVVIMLLQILSFKSVFSINDKYQDIQRYAGVIEWLNNNEKSCVVFVLEEEIKLNPFITAYTPCDVYHSHYVFMAVPEERIMHNYISLLRITGVTQETISDYLEQDRRNWQDLFYSNWREKFAQKKDPWLQTIEEPNQLDEFFSKTPKMIINEFNKSSSVSLADYLNMYEFDYLIVDQKNNPVSVESYFKAVYNDAGIFLYEFKHE